MAIEIEQLEDAINETERTDGQQSIVDWAARCFLAQQKATEQDVQECGRSACKTENPEWFNPGTQKWYCDKCAAGINEILDHPLCWHRDNLPALTQRPAAPPSEVIEAIADRLFEALDTMYRLYEDGEYINETDGNSIGQAVKFGDGQEEEVIAVLNEYEALKAAQRQGGA